MLRPTGAVQPRTGLRLIVRNLNLFLASGIKFLSLALIDLLDILYYINDRSGLLALLADLTANLKPSTRGIGTEKSLASNARYL